MGEPAFTLELKQDGRVLFPVALRESLGLQGGDRLVVRVTGEGHAEIVTARIAARGIYGMYAHLATGDKRISDELIQDRRVEAAKE